MKSGRSGSESFGFRSLSSHTTVRAVRHTAVWLAFRAFQPPSSFNFCCRLIIPISVVVTSYTFQPLHLVGNSCRNTRSQLMSHAIWSFTLTCSKSATTTSADFSAFVVTADCSVAETSRDKPYIFHRLLARFTHQGYGHL